MPGQDEDISPYATFHLLGMREEAKNNGNPGNFQTMPNGMGQGQQAGATNPNTPAHMRAVSHTMNVRVYTAIYSRAIFRNTKYLFLFNFVQFKCSIFTNIYFRIAAPP